MQTDRLASSAGQTCVFIAAPSYSGSTLLTMLLGAHPGVATVGEMKGGQEDLATYACSCGALFADCPFWNQLIDSLASRGFRYDLSDRRTMPAFSMPGSRLGDRVMQAAYRGRTFEMVRDCSLGIWPSWNRRLNYVRAYTRTFIQFVLDELGATTFVDSSKDAVRIKFLAGVSNLDLRVVQLVRDGRGVINSARKNLGLSARAATQEWRDSHRQIERVLRGTRISTWVRVRYEDLCRNPQCVLDQLLEFASVSGPYNTASAARRSQHILGNRMRLKGAFPIRLDESWRHELSASDLAVFEQIAGPVNRAYGYE